jgi:hypothetical protein
MDKANHYTVLFSGNIGCLNYILGCKQGFSVGGQSFNRPNGGKLEFFSYKIFWSGFIRVDFANIG